MPSVIDELVTILGLDLKPGTKAVVDGFNASLDAVTGFAVRAGVALMATATTIGYFVERTTRAAGELDKFQQLTGLSTIKVQAWQYAVERAGGSAASLTADLMGLTKSMSSPIPGEFNHALFMLGVNVRKSSGEMKTADEVLLNIADKFRGMSKQHQIQWGSRIGLSDDTILLLQQGRKAIMELHQQAADIPTIVDEKHLKAAREFTIQLSLVRRVMTYLGQTAASAAGPVLKKIVQDFTEFLRLNREFIQLGLGALVEGVALGFHRFWLVIQDVKGVLFEFLPSLKKLTEGLVNVETVSQVVFVILTALAVVLAILTIKWIAVGAAIAAAVIIFEDILVYFQGGESVLGRLIDKVEDLYNKFKERFPHITGFVEMLINALGRLAKMTFNDTIQAFRAIAQIIGEIASVIAFLGEGGLKILDKMMGFTVGDLFSWGNTGPSMYSRMYSGVNQGTGQGNAAPQITINQNISGSNAVAIAEESAQKVGTTLLNMQPGGMAPAMQ